MKKDLAMSRKRLSYSTYGYDFTIKDLIGTIIFLCIATYAVCIINKLNTYYSMICGISVGCSVPFLVTSYFKYKYESTKFEEYCMYFDYMKIHFKTKGKVNIALENTRNLFDEKSHMYSCISDALKIIEESGDYKKALNCIDKDYHNSYLERFHNLLITGEEHGSNTVYENLDTINFNVWKEDIKVYQKEKKLYKAFLIFFFCLSMALVIYGTDLGNKVLEDFYLEPDYQSNTFMALETIIMSFIFIYIALTNKKWIRSDE